MTQKRTMTSKVCKACQRTIFINENGSRYEDAHRRNYHTDACCLTIQLATAKEELDEARDVLGTILSLGVLSLVNHGSTKPRAEALFERLSNS